MPFFAFHSYESIRAFTPTIRDFCPECAPSMYALAGRRSTYSRPPHELGRGQARSCRPATTRSNPASRWGGCGFDTPPPANEKATPGPARIRRCLPLRRLEMTRGLELVPQPDGEPRRRRCQAPPCAACGRPLKVTFQKLRPHRTKPGLEMYEIYARCTKLLLPHRYVSWAEYDPRKGDPLPAPEFRPTR